MKNIILRTLVLFLLLLTQNINAQRINFKDNNLKIALLELGFDFNKNNEIEISEIDTITSLKISKRNIKHLDDLMYFKKLKVINAMTNEIQNLEVFFNNSVIEEIYIGENQLGKKLTLKNIPNLKGLYAFRNNLEEIQLIATDNIQSLYLQGNSFKKGEFKNLLKLKSLQLSENTELKIIDISNNKELGQLYLTDTGISKLDITNNPLLKTLYVENNVELLKNNSQTNFKPMPIINSSN
jgi:hypothetical protein